MTRRPILWTAIVVGVGFSVLAVILASQVDSEPSFRGGSLLGEPAPAVTLQDLDGREVRLTDYAGQTVVVNFWNEWCQPCKDEYPSLVAFHDAHRAEGDVVMLAVLRASGGRKAVEAWLESRPIVWEILDDPGANASVAFGTTGQPETYVIAPNGIVAAAQKGPTSFADLERMLAAAREML